MNLQSKTHLHLNPRVYVPGATGRARPQEKKKNTTFAKADTRVGLSFIEKSTYASVDILSGVPADS